MSLRRSEAEKVGLSTFSYNPERALIIYRQEGDERDGVCYIEDHEITVQNGRAQLGAGKPMIREVLEELMQLVIKNDGSQITNTGSLMPENVLYLDQQPGKSILIWWEPSGKQAIVYNDSERSVTVTVPPMLFVSKNGAKKSLYAFAMRKNSRPNLKTKLYAAPFSNIYAGGNVCLGTAKAPVNETDITKLIEGWDKTFWGSKFTGENQAQYDQKALDELWKKSNKEKWKTFPAIFLKPHAKQKTLESLIKTFNKNYDDNDF